jgi:hypothetical protein
MATPNTVNPRAAYLSCSSTSHGTSLVGFLTRPGKHLRRRVNSIDSASGADTSLGGNGKCAGTAAYVQDRLAGFQARQVERLFAVRMLSAK